MQKRIRVGKLKKLQQHLTALSAVERLKWATHLFGAKAVATACLGADCAVLLHMLSQSSPETRVFVMASGDVSGETQEVVEAMERRLGLRMQLLDLLGAGGDALDAGEGLTLALDEAFLWISDARREQSFGNSQTSVLEQMDDGLYRLNPLFDWSPQQVEDYRRAHDLPQPRHQGWRAILQGQADYSARHAGH